MADDSGTGLGAFSISLAVEDLGRSQAFYETLGFETAGGDAEGGWLIMRSGTAVVGLFQGMFEGNIITLNPGWGPDASPVDPFEDVRSIKERVKAAGIDVVVEMGDEAEGPASFVVVDPDGNQVMFDQHR